AEQARSALDQMIGNSARAKPESAGETTQAVGSATLWLSATVLLSLVLGMLGGMIGVRGSRRIIRRDGDRVVPRPRILSRT
ncbi:MAG TPA: hypothetical protein VNT02_06450, partial [Burkholderiales bacterium]|nr:hypothetical protein [Burkholderiales bacterium]